MMKGHEISDNGATRLLAAIAAEEIRDALKGNGDMETAENSLKVLLYIIAEAVPNTPKDIFDKQEKPTQTNNEVNMFVKMRDNQEVVQKVQTNLARLGFVENKKV